MGALRFAGGAVTGNIMKPYQPTPSNPGYLPLSQPCVSQCWILRKAIEKATRKRGPTQQEAQQEAAQRAALRHIKAAKAGIQ